MKEYMMNQKDFAELLGIDFRQYNRYEHTIQPSLEIALRIAHKLSRDIKDIFYLVD